MHWGRFGRDGCGAAVNTPPLPPLLVTAQQMSQEEERKETIGPITGLIIELFHYVVESRKEDEDAPTVFPFHVPADATWTYFRAIFFLFNRRFFVLTQQHKVSLQPSDGGKRRLEGGVGV